MKYLLLLPFVVLAWGCGQKNGRQTETATLPGTTMDNPPPKDTLVLEDLLTYPNADALMAHYGPAHVQRRTHIAGPEGESVIASVLFPDTEHELIFFWKDSKNMREIESIECRSKASPANPWHSRRGLKMGLPLTEVVRLNAHDFTLSGIGWDYGGYVLNWQGGELDHTGLIVQFGTGAEQLLTLSRQQTEAIMGDREVSSAETAWQRVPLRIERLGVRPVTEQ